MVKSRQIILSGTDHESNIGFAQASRIDELLCISGTGPCDEFGQTIGLDDAHLQAQRCFEKGLDSVLKAGGAAEDIIRTRVFITSRDNLSIVAKVHREFFSSIQPACSILIVQGLLHHEWLVQVEIDAYIKSL